MPDEMWCWSCYGRQQFREIEKDLFKCETCGTVRDLTEPKEVFPKAGE